jgi:hypothetical protein
MELNELHIPKRFIIALKHLYLRECKQRSWVHSPFSVFITQRISITEFYYPPVKGPDAASDPRD